LKNFKTLTNPKGVEKILNENRKFIWGEKERAHAMRVSITQSYRDTRSYNLAARYDFRLKPSAGAKKRHSIFALSHSDGRKKYAHAMNDIIFRHFLGAQKQITVPRPYKYVERYRLFLLEYIKGSTLASILVKEKSPRTNHLISLMDWLAHLHGAKVHPKIKRRINFYHLEHNIKVLKERGHKDALAFEKKFKRIKKQMKLWRKSHGTTVVHGDFNPSNVIIKGNSIAVVDFENVYVGDYLIDAANMLSYIIMILRDTGAKKQFMRLYQENRGKLTPSEKRRFSLYVDYFSLLFKTHPLVWGK